MHVWSSLQIVHRVTCQQNHGLLFILYYCCIVNKRNTYAVINAVVTFIAMITIVAFMSVLLLLLQYCYILSISRTAYIISCLHAAASPLLLLFSFLSPLYAVYVLSCFCLSCLSCPFSLFSRFFPSCLTLFNALSVLSCFSLCSFQWALDGVVAVWDDFRLWSVRRSANEIRASMYDELTGAG